MKENNLNVKTNSKQDHVTGWEKKHHEREERLAFLQAQMETI